MSSRKQNDIFIPISFLCATCSILCFLATFYVLTYATIDEKSPLSAIILSIVGGIFWILFVKIMLIHATPQKIFELLCVQVVIAFFTFVISICGYNYSRIAEVHFSRYCCYIVMLFSSALSIISIFVFGYKNKDTMHISTSFQVFRKHFFLAIPILLVTGISICCMLPGMQNEVSGDAGLNYRFYQNDRNIASLNSFNTMDAYSHLGYAYSITVLSLKSIFGDAAVAAHISNAILYIFGALAFYGSLRLLVPGKKNITYYFATLIWIWGPFHWGLLDDTTWDYWLAPLMMLIIYFSLRKMMILEVFVGTIFIFTKEPALIVFASWTVGLIIMDLIFYKKNGFKIIKALNYTAKETKYWITLVIGVAWLWLYNNFVHWSYATSGSYVFNISYVFEKISALRILNFTWLVTCMMIFYLVLCLIRKQTLNGWVWPMLLSDISFLIFSCIFQTVNNPRYIDSATCIPYLMAAILIVSLGKDKISRIISGLCAIIMAMSTFSTIDPISRKLYQNAGIGEGTLLQVGYGLHEGVTYNVQHVGFENAINKALQEPIEENIQIFMPLINNNVWYFNGLGIWEISDKYTTTTEYWDNHSARRYSYAHRANDIQPFKVYNIVDFESIPELMNYSKACYIYMDTQGKNIADNIRANFQTISEDTFNSLGWTIHCIIFTI